MEKKENMLLVEVFVNGVPRIDHIPFKKDVNTSVISYLETIKDPDHTIAALYNARESALDVIDYGDEYKTVTELSRFIKEYPSDIADTSLFAIVNTGYARQTIGMINACHRIMKKFIKKDEKFGLIKRN